MTYSRKGKANLLPTEEQEQRALVQWLEMRGILFYNVPNGGMRDAREGRKFKFLVLSRGFRIFVFLLGVLGITLSMLSLSGGWAEVYLHGKNYGYKPYAAEDRKSVV